MARIRQQQLETQMPLLMEQLDSPRPKRPLQVYNRNHGEQQARASWDAIVPAVQEADGVMFDLKGNNQSTAAQTQTQQQEQQEQNSPSAQFPTDYDAFFQQQQQQQLDELPLQPLDPVLPLPGRKPKRKLNSELTDAFSELLFDFGNDQQGEN